MNQNEDKKPVLDCLIKRDLAGITFVRDYIQFLFDGPVFNTYTLPSVKTTKGIFGPKTPGYRDVLCGLIGTSVTATHEEPKVKISIQFVDGASIEVSLKNEDRVCAEAATLQTGSAKDWNVW
jgi:hypothetical protein